MSSKLINGRYRIDEESLERFNKIADEAIEKLNKGFNVKDGKNRQGNTKDFNYVKHIDIESAGYPLTREIFTIIIKYSDSEIGRFDIDGLESKDIVKIVKKAVKENLFLL